MPRPILIASTVFRYIFPSARDLFSGIPIHAYVDDTSSTLLVHLSDILIFYLTLRLFYHTFIIFTYPLRVVFRLMSWCFRKCLMIYRPGMEEYEDQEANSGLAEYELAGVIYTDKEGGRIMLRVMIGGKKYVSVISQKGDKMDTPFIDAAGDPSPTQTPDRPVTAMYSQTRPSLPFVTSTSTPTSSSNLQTGVTSPVLTQIAQQIPNTDNLTLCWNDSQSYSLRSRVSQYRQIQINEKKVIRTSDIEAFEAEVEAQAGLADSFISTPFDSPSLSMTTTEKSSPEISMPSTPYCSEYDIEPLLYDPDIFDSINYTKAIKSYPKTTYPKESKFYPLTQINTSFSDSPFVSSPTYATSFSTSPISVSSSEKVVELGNNSHIAVTETHKWFETILRDVDTACDLQDELDDALEGRKAL